MDEIFDPEIHSVDKEGNPTLNKDGSFRKKRRDAGQKLSTPRTPRAAKPSPTAATGAAAVQRGRYVKAVTDNLAPLAVVVSLVDPVDGFCAQQLTPMWGEVLADLAMEQPKLAAVLERAAGFGAVGGAVALGVLTVMQFSHNHGKVPAPIVRMVGGTPREEIEQMLQQRGEQLAKQDRAEKQDQEERHAAAA
jgi:hypothetical protein